MSRVDDERQGAREQRDVLEKKGNALKSGLGLQIWGPQEGDEREEPGGDPAGGHGNASMGTAERQAKGGYVARKPHDEEKGA